MSQLTAEQFERVEQAFYRKLMRHRFTPTEWEILRIVNALSFQRRSAAAYIEKQRLFMELSDLKGMQHESAVSAALKELFGNDVLLYGPPGFYWINTNFKDWDVDLIHPLGTDWNGIYTPTELAFDPPELKYLMREYFLAKVAGEVIQVHEILPAQDRGASADWAPGRTDQDVLQRPESDGGKHGGNAMRPNESERNTGRPAGGNPPRASGESESGGGGSPEKTNLNLKLSSGLAAVQTVQPGAAVARDGNKLNLKLSSPTPTNKDGPPDGLNLKLSNLIAAGKPGAEAAPALSPPHTPPLGTFNVETLRSTLNESKGLNLKLSPPGLRRFLRSQRISFQEESRLIDLIADCLPEDMEGSGKFWRIYVVRNLKSEVIEEWVADCKSRRLTGYVFRKGPAAWLNNSLARAIGVDSLGKLPPGMPPE